MGDFYIWLKIPQLFDVREKEIAESAKSPEGSFSGGFFFNLESVAMNPKYPGEVERKTRATLGMSAEHLRHRLQDRRLEVALDLRDVRRQPWSSFTEITDSLIEGKLYTKIHQRLINHNIILYNIRTNPIHRPLSHPAGNLDQCCLEKEQPKYLDFKIVYNIIILIISYYYSMIL